MQIPDGTATVSVEVLHLAKAGHWVTPREGYAEPVRRKSGELLKRVDTKGLQVRTFVLCCGNSAAASYRGAAAFLLLQSVLLFPPGAAQTDAIRSQLNIAYQCRKVIR